MSMSLRRMRGGRRRERGQSLVEFALVAPIFFILVFGIIQVGLVMAAQNGLVDGVRNAARRAATYRINEESFNPVVFGSICATIQTDLNTRLHEQLIGYAPGRVTSNITYEWVTGPDGAAAGYFLVAHVQATYGNPLYVPLISFFLDSSDGTTDGKMSLQASEQMRVENPPLVPVGLPTTVYTC
jgi:Flp pilus assembly protein TadG